MATRLDLNNWNFPIYDDIPPGGEQNDNEVVRQAQTEEGAANVGTANVVVSNPHAGKAEQEGATSGQINLQQQRPRMNWEKIMQAMNPLETKQEREAREKKDKRRLIWKTIGDGVAAIANMYGTTHGAPNVRQVGQLTARQQQRMDQALAERNANRQNYINQYLRQMQSGNREERLRNQYELKAQEFEWKRQIDERNFNYKREVDALKLQLQNRQITLAEFNERLRVLNYIQQYYGSTTTSTTTHRPNDTTTSSRTTGRNSVTGGLQSDLDYLGAMPGTGANAPTDAAGTPQYTQSELQQQDAATNATQNRVVKPNAPTTPTTPVATTPVASATTTTQTTAAPVSSTQPTPQATQPVTPSTNTNARSAQQGQRTTAPQSTGRGQTRTTSTRSRSTQSRGSATRSTRRSGQVRKPQARKPQSRRQGSGLTQGQQVLRNNGW